MREVKVGHHQDLCRVPSEMKIGWIIFIPKGESALTLGVVYPLIWLIR
jgi:hypothetical protein